VIRAFVWALAPALAWGACLSCETKKQVEPPPPAAPREVAEPIHLVLPPDPDADHVERAPVLEEKEPNDFPEFALPLPPGTTARGYINEPRMRITQVGPDRDTYRFVVPGTQKMILWARLTGVPRINLYLAIHNEKNERIYLQDANREGGDEIIVNLTMAPGTYHFEVGERWLSSAFMSDLKNPYTLSWKLSEPSPGQEIEPNDGRQTANPLQPGQGLKGYTHAPGDVDFFRLNFGSRILRLEFRTIPDVPMAVSFWSAEGREPVRRLVVNPKDGLVLRRFSAQALGVEYLAVGGAGRAYSLTGQYEVTVSFETSGDQFEVEPNDQLARANPLTGLTGVVTGSISHATDRDFYAMTFSRDMSVSLSLLAPPQLPQVRYCLMPLRRCVTQWSETMDIHHQVLAKGSYWVEVEGGKSYHPEASYSLRWRFEVASDSDEREPNDRPGQAGKIAPGTLVRGFLLPKGDVDYFSFQLPGKAGNPPVARVELSGGEAIDPALAIVDAYGNVTVEDAAGLYSGSRKVQTALHPGHRYFVRVREKSGNAGSPKTPYLLRLTHVNATPAKSYK
jgi:hypothetical protein